MLLILFLTLAGALPALAQSDRWDRQVDSAAARAGQALATQGYRPAGKSHRGDLFAGETATITIPLAPETAYAVVGVCDDDCEDLQLVLVSTTRYEVDADRRGTVVPIVRTTSADGGIYHVNVTMAACRVSPCRYEIVVLARPSPRSRQ
ncbi:MAG TPA: hypothetical protein VFI39_07420 [Gemmatimonadales bacterium]|nr:hypothetical protein [Gemmatimonadales bacterium]